MPDFATLQQIDQGQVPLGGGAMSSSYPMVPPHAAPDGSGAMTNLSDADYAKLHAGIQAPPTPVGNGAAIDVAGARPAAPPAPSNWLAKFQAADAASDAALKSGGKPAAAPAPAPDASAGAAAPPKMTGFVANTGAATNEAIAGLLGLGPTVVNSILNLVPRGINAAAGTNIPLLPTNQQQTIEGAMGPFNPQNVVPATPNEALARATARGAASVALGGVAGGALAPVATGVAAPIAEGMAAGASPGGAAIGAVGGAVGHGARAAVPPEYGDVADMLGNIVGGGLAAGAAAGLTAAGRIGASAYARMRAPLSIGPQETLINPETGQPFTAVSSNPEAPGEPITATAGQQQLAAGQLASAARMSPGELIAAIPPAGEGVPGSALSVGQQTGNLGSLRLERTLRTGNPVPFTEAEAANQNARVAALRGMAGPEAAGDAAGKFVADRLAQLRSLEAALDKSGRETAQRVTEQLGGNPGAMSEQELGAAHQAALDALRIPIKRAASSLYDTIDGDGTKALSVKPVVEAAKKALSEVNARMGGSLSDAERGVLTAASQMRPVELFSDVRDLDKALGEAQRAIRNDPKLGAESSPYRRITIVRNAVDSAMVDAAADAAKKDATLVAAGQKAPGETAGEKFAAQHENVAGSGGSGLGAHPEGAGTGPAAGQGVNGGPDREAAGPGGGSGRAATDSGVAAEATTLAKPAEAPAPALAPNFTASDRAALRDANAAYREYKQTWRDGPIGQVLASAQSPSGFKMPAAQVAKTLFRPGPQGATAADALIKAAGSPEEAAKVLGDYPAYAFRRAAERDGVIDPNLADKWIAAHKDTLEKFPGMADRFSTAAKATQIWQDAAAHTQDTIKAFQDSALGRYLSKSGEPVEPQVAMGKLFASPTGPADARAMVRAMSGNQAAADGLKRNLVDYLIQRTRATAEAGTTGEKEIAGAAFQKIAADPKQMGVIRAVLGDEGAVNVTKIAKDIEMATRAWNATKIPASPGSAADTHALAQHLGQHPSVVGQVIIGEAAGEAAGHLLHVAGPAGSALRAAITVGTVVGQALRNAGMSRVDDLARQAVLQPELARLLLSKVQIKPGSPILKTLGQRIGQIGLSSAAQEKH
jgi:hypothetical protein